MLKDPIPKYAQLQGSISTELVFTVNETIQLMKRYSHLTYIAVQASRSADRCDRENNEKGIIKYVSLMLKANQQLLELKSKMREWQTK